MKVYGKIIKRRRVKYGLSQYQLSEGICAQATISLIENRNVCPKLDILTSIGQRLNIPIKSILNSPINSQDVETAILRGEYERAEQRLSRIPQSKFKLHHQMSRYFCYLGMLAIVNDDYQNALYYFNKTLSQNSRLMNRYCHAWANIGISYVYLKQSDKQKSLEFAKIAKRNLNLDLTYNVHHLKVFVILRLELAKLFNQLNVFTISNVVCFQTISDLTKVHSMYKLSDVYTWISQNYVKLDRYKEAEYAKWRAKVFYRIYKEPDSLSC